MLTVSINEAEGYYLELFRIALSVKDHAAKSLALRNVKHVVIAEELKKLSEKEGIGWTSELDNQSLVAWVAQTAAERDEAIYEFSRVSRAYEDRNEIGLQVAEQAAKLIFLSVLEERFAGLHTPIGILDQITVAAKERRTRGAMDKDTVRKSWKAYRGVSHLGAAMDLFDDPSGEHAETILLAQHIGQVLSHACPKGTRSPYVPREEQIFFSYRSRIYGPRLRNRGLPFSVDD